MMKKQRNLVLALCVICMFAMGFIPIIRVQATTLEEQVTTTVAFGEYEQIDLKTKEATILKIILKERGSFVLDFSPISIKGLQAELYDEESNLLGSGGRWFSSDSYVSPLFVGYNKDLEAGTYYLRLYVHEQGTYTYFARQVVSEDTSIEICIDLEVGKSIQLGTILTNSKDKGMKWSSSKKNVATVSTKGKVKAVKKGTTVIKVYNSSGLISKLKVRVVAKK